MRQYTLEVLPKFPARVEAGAGISIDKANGVYTIGADFDTVGVVAPPLPADTMILVQLPDGSYATAPLDQIVGTSLYFQTRAAAQAVTIAAAADGGPQAIVTLGYATAGDGGGASYARASASTNGGFQSADGQWWKLAEPEINIRMTGAVLDGVTPDDPAINTAVAAAIELGAKSVFCPAGTSSITAPVIPAAGVVIRGVAGQSIWEADALTFLLQARGSYNAGQSNTLASNALAGTTSITLSAGNGANFTQDKWVIIGSEAAGVGTASNTQKRGEFVYIENKTGDVLTLSGPLEFDYLTADTAQMFPVTWLENLVVEGITFQSSDPDVNFGRTFCDLEFCLRPLLDNCIFQHGRSSGVFLKGCVQAVVSNVRAVDMLSDDATAFGYVVCEAALNVDLLYSDSVGERVRHMYTTAGTSVGATIALNYGVPMFSTISACTAINPRATGFDTHPFGFGTTFSDCIVTGGASQGFQLRAVKGKVSGGAVYNCIGAAVADTNDAIDSEVSGLMINRTNLGTDYTAFDWSSHGAFYINSVGGFFHDNVIVDVGGPAFEVIAGSAPNDVRITDNIIRNPMRIGSTITKAAILAAMTGGYRLNISDNSIFCSDTKMDYGIHQASANPVVTCLRNTISGSQVAQTLLTGNTRSIWGNSGSNIISAGNGQAITIAGGIITVANAATNLIIINGEGGAADDLDTINGGNPGDIIYFRRGGAVIITLKNGTGNILNGKSGADVAIGTGNACYAYMKFGNSWLQL